LIIAIATAMIMTLFSWGLSFKLLNNPEMLMSVNPLNLLPQASSMVTSFAVVLISGLVFAATSEELFKLAIFAEATERWGKTGYKIGRITVPSVFIAVGFPVTFWALLHSISAYSNLLMVIPAFVNGIILIVVLWYTKSILTVIAAHWGYNSFISLLMWTRGDTGLASGTPLFPNIFSPVYWSNNGWVYDLMVGMLIVAMFALFLVPSLTKHR
jgi:membrane protease YdiL (CAAX protease family)